MVLQGKLKLRCKKLFAFELGSLEKLGAGAELCCHRGAHVVAEEQQQCQQVDAGALRLAIGLPMATGIKRHLLVERKPSSRPTMHRCHTVLGAVWRRRRVLAWLSVDVEKWCSSAGYSGSMVETSYYAQHKLHLLTIQLGVCRSGHS